MSSQNGNHHIVVLEEGEGRWSRAKVALKDESAARKTRRRQARRRRTGRTRINENEFDQKILWAGTLILMFYAFITIRAYHSIPLNQVLLIPHQQKHQQQEQIPEHKPKNIPIKFNDDSLQEKGPLLPQYKFPIKVSEYEQIPHPGNAQVSLRVPTFWKALSNHSDVRDYWDNYGDRLMTPEQARSVGSTIDHEGQKLETIYIAISSYRDDECRPTVESLFARARYPQRIRVAVTDQRSAGTEDPSCLPPTAAECENIGNDSYLAVVCPRLDLIDYYEMEAKNAVGPVFARHLGHRMYRGEYFAAQSDAHVRFVQDWDVAAVVQWKSAKNEMAVLTTYLSDLQNSIDPVTHKAIRSGRPIMCQSDYEGSGVNKHLRHGQQPEGPAGIHGEPTLHPFWAAGFSFARGHFIVNVPYDQYLPMIFQGEEISMGLRGFTYGYDYYTPEHSVCFHMYAIGVNKEKRKKVKLFWENQKYFPGAGRNSMKRLNGIIGMSTDEYLKVEEKKYGLGHIRTTKKFFETFGIDVKAQKVQKNLCRFVGKPMHFMFKKRLRPNTMGIDYSQIRYKFKDPMADGNFRPNWVNVE